MTTIDLYRTPRYSDSVSEALRDSADSSMWDDWDLSGLLYDTPHAYAKKIGASHGIFCSTGTAGLHASLMSLDLQPGDEVVVPCMTFIRAVTPLVHLGLVPVLADVDPLTGNLCPESLSSVVTSRTRAVIVVHMWGIPADIVAIKRVCDERQLLLIEDFSHAHFSEHQDGVVGSFGDVSFASMQRKKTFSVGEGGLIVTSNDAIYERLQGITSPGSFKNTKNYNEFSGFGLNMRMSPFSGVVAKCLLSDVDEIVSSRVRHAEVFDKLISERTETFASRSLPSYVKVVSAYGYKPVLLDPLDLSKLMAGNSFGKWKFSAFSYESIAASVFWRKSRAHYPFCQNITPIGSTLEFNGCTAYLRGRISLSVPTVRHSYWTDKTVNEWRDLLALLCRQ